jgi:hypothetical protein
MKIYHVTESANVPGIQRNGFKEGNHWFADRAMFGDITFEGEPGPHSAVELDIPEDAIAEWEDTMFHDQHPDHREWEIPHDVLNRHLGTATVLPQPT